MQEEILKKILLRLDCLISLQINPLPERLSDQEIINFLDRFHLESKDIATILGKSADKISKQKYAIKTRKRVKK